MRLDSPNAKPFAFEGGRHGCLLLHGFTNTPASMRPLGERLRRAGYTVRAPLLAGHGTTMEALKASTWRDWLAGAREAYAQLRRACPMVTVIGHSMGGALALLLAEEYPVDSLVCIAAALRVHEELAWAAPAIALIKPEIPWQLEKRESDPQYLHEYDCSLAGMPTGKGLDMFRLTRKAERNLYAVVAPTLVVRALKDQTVPPVAAELIMAGISARDKTLVDLENSPHMCVIGGEREKLFDCVLQHLRHVDDTKSLAF